MEQAKGHTGNNIVTVLMCAKNIDLQDAADLVGKQFEVLMNRWVKAKDRVSSLGEEFDADVQKYIEATGHWVKGNLEYVIHPFFQWQRSHLNINIAGALKRGATLVLTTRKSKRLVLSF